jgi:nucleotide-binding universal stress UspA family protein
MLPFRKILFPVDYSESCRAIVPYVKETVQHFSAQLTVTHAYAPQPSLAFSSAEGVLVYSELAGTAPVSRDEIRLQEEQRLREFAAQAFPGQHVDAIVQEGEPGSVIHHVIQHEGADLVMMPTRGLGPLRRFLLGSVTAKVLHDVTVPVWTGAGSALTDHHPAAAYNSIVCALNDSDEAEAVLRAAAALAHSYRARLSLVRVVETPPPASEIDFTPYRKELMDSADVWVRELKDQLGIDASHCVIDSQVAEGVHQEAVRLKADLIVVGRGHAQGTFSRLWSRLYQIVRESPCPVLSI